MRHIFRQSAIKIISHARRGHLHRIAIKYINKTLHNVWSLCPISTGCLSNYLFRNPLIECIWKCDGEIRARNMCTSWKNRVTIMCKQEAETQKIQLHQYARSICRAKSQRKGHKTAADLWSHARTPVLNFHRQRNGTVHFSFCRAIRACR